jgi:hypothetical protein
MEGLNIQILMISLDVSFIDKEVIVKVFFGGGRMIAHYDICSFCF